MPIPRLTGNEAVPRDLEGDPMQGVSVDVIDGSVQLDCREFALDDVVISEQIQTLVPLLERLLSADCARNLLSDDVFQRRFRAIAARDMILQASLAATIRNAEVLIDIITGSASIADHGFPEFQDDHDIDV